MSPSATARSGPAGAGGRVVGRATGAGKRKGRVGRRPGSSDTRERILGAARVSFGERGLEATTIRDVARRAEVDPALVHHYFGSKQRLFVAAMALPVDFGTVVPQLLEGPPDELGERFVRFLLDLWETPAMRPLMLGIIRSATTDPVAGAMLRRDLAGGPLLALARAIDRPDAPLRAALAGSQLVGLMMARYVVGVEPLASAPRETIVRSIGPTIQRYLTRDLGPSDAPVTGSRSP
jgi:AcrR family transcriptional regulator